VRYSNDGTWDTETWESASATKAWTLTLGDGVKTVYYQIKDNAELLSTTYQDTIILQTPTTTTPTSNPTSTTVPTSAPTPTKTPTPLPTTKPTPTPTIPEFQEWIILMVILASTMLTLLTYFEKHKRTKFIRASFIC
jgi:hypothetical protein